MKAKWWVAAACIAALAVTSVVMAGLATGGTKANQSTQATKSVALISDVGHFNDKSFNQSQLEGLMKAKSKLGIKAIPKQSNSASDYLPNLTGAIRQRANLVISAGFLLAPATATVAKRFPNTHFAITDYSTHIDPFADKKGKLLVHNVEGLTYAANESGCLVGTLAAQMAKKMGGNTVGAVGGIKIPPVDIWIAGYKFCAQKAVPGTKVLVNYSQDFVASDKCKAQAQNLISRGAKVLFQVAGLCGLGTLKAADDAKIWGIGVDKDQYFDAKRVLTSGVKRVDVGIYSVARQEKLGKFRGGTDLLFNLKNHGMSVGRINPSVPRSFIAKMNAYKARIIAGKLKPPTHL